MNQHVSEDALVAMAIGDADEDARVHVAVCADCASRLDDLTRLLADVRTAAFDEADEIFDAERLERQRDHVLRRIEHAGRPARVIEFPHRSGHSARPMRPLAVRWVAAAAAAGLVIGVYAGSHMPTGDRGAVADAQLTRNVAIDRPVQEAAGRELPPIRSDEEILSDVETALTSQRGPVALAALDALTPRVSEIGLRIRY